MSLVRQQSSRSLHNTPRDNRCSNSKESNSKINKFPSPVIPVLPTLNDSVIDTTQLSLVPQQSSRYSYNTTHELQYYLIPGRISPDPSNTMPLPSTKNRDHNIYGCMVDVYKLTPEQRQQHAVMLLQHYHKLCNTNKSSSICVSPPLILNMESLSQSTISSLDNGSFGRNRADMNIQPPTTSEGDDTEKLMAYNEYLEPPPPHDI